MIPFINPENKKKLQEIKKDEHVFACDSYGNKYNVSDGIFDLIYPHELREQLSSFQNYYDCRASEYENCLHLTFKTHRIDEKQCRNKFIDELNLTSKSRVLEIACGTGRDSTIIADRIPDGELHLVDISLGMLKLCQEKLKCKDIKQFYSLANVSKLPYPDDYFDAIYSFGGLGEFPDIKGSLTEMTRVAKEGSKIVVGDESIPIWLRNTYFSKVLTKTNPQFLANLPLEYIPVEARNLKLQYVINNVFYLIDFKVGKGEPFADFDFTIPGIRGGTYRTRYEGELEGVRPKTKEAVLDYCKKNNLSIHDFLEEIILTKLDNNQK